MIQKLQQWIHRPFFTFTTSYILVIIILLFTCLFSAAQVFHIHEQSILTSNAALLRQSGENIASSLDTCELFSEILMKHGELRKMMSLERHTYVLASVLRQMPYYNDSNQVVIDYFIYARKPDVILGASRCFINISQYYDNFFQIGTMDYNEWRASILSTRIKSELIPAGDMMVNMQFKRGLLFLTPYVDLTTGMPLGNIVYIMDEAKIHRLLLRGDWNAESICCILDKDGSVLTASSANCENEIAALAGSEGQNTLILAGERYLAATYVSPKFGLTYCIAYPYRLLWAFTWNDIGLYIMLTGLIFIFATVVILVFYRGNHRPLKCIADRLSLSESERFSLKKGLWGLSDGVEHLDSLNKSLQMSILEQQTQLRNMLFSHLEQGNVTREGFLEQLLAHINLPFKGVQYRGVYICLDTSKTNPQQTVFQEAQLINELKKSRYLLFMSMSSANHFTCLFYANTPEVKVEEVLTAFYRSLSEQYGIECFFAVGAATLQLCDVHHSFKDAAALLEKRYCGQYLLIQDNIRPSFERYVYSVNDAQCLRHAVDENNEIAIDDMLNRIYRENFEELSLHSFQRTLLYYRMLEGIDPAKLSDQMRYHLNECKPTVFFSELRALYHQMRKDLAENRLQEQQTLIKNILAYIQQHMNDANLSLAQVSDQFKMNEKYMSYFIHKHSGTVFTTYLENIRIREAKRLLKETDLSINDISLRAGYLNANSFRRAFHRVSGESPSQYRNASFPKKRRVEESRHSLY